MGIRGQWFGVATLAIRDNNMLITMSPTRGEWFRRFIKVNNMREGVTKRKHVSLSLESLHALLSTLERDYIVV